MRWVLVLVLVAAAAAVAAGLTVPSSALTVNAVSLSHHELNDELAAIEASPSWQCYLQAVAYNSGNVVPTTVTGVPTQSWATTTAVEWANQRADQLAVVQYIEAHNPAGLADSALPAAQQSLESAITDEISAAYNTRGTSGSFSCTAPKLGPATLASMPQWFQHDQVVAEAADLALVQLLPTSLPTSGPGLAAWYAQHKDAFTTVCLSYIAVSDEHTAAIVQAKIRGGMAFATAARRYSRAANAPRGGVFGCVGPSSQSYTVVRPYTDGVPVNGLSRIFPNPAGRDVLLFTVTRRTVNPLHTVLGPVVAAVDSINRSAASLLAAQVQRAAHVTVSSMIGTFVQTSLGGTIVPPTQPPANAVLNASANTP